ncbi:MAG: hypothetical protein JO051_05570 [Acidobacteriaceae bacterium]|nr:hypothetical protein [Acidobacteriaceae bacterium]
MANVLLFYTQRFEEAESVLRQIVLLDRNNRVANFSLLRLFKMTGRDEQMRAKIERCRGLFEAEDLEILLALLESERPQL